MSIRETRIPYITLELQNTDEPRKKKLILRKSHNERAAQKRKDGWPKKSSIEMSQVAQKLAPRTSDSSKNETIDYMITAKKLRIRTQKTGVVSISVADVWKDQGRHGFTVMVNVVLVP